MSANTTPKFRQKDFEWETLDGEVQGIYGNFDYEIIVSARPTAKDTRWGSTDTTERTWTVWGTDHNELATGEAADLRAAKSAALAAINAHLGS